MGMIAPVDSFYVAFFRDDQHLVFPYIFDGHEYEPPGFQIYGPSGVAAWIKTRARPYRYQMDDGRLLHLAHSFGDEERLSEDAIAIPLFGPSADGPTVIGIASMQTYQSAVYDDEIAHAFQWVGRSVVTALSREREDVAILDSLSAGDELIPAPISIAEAVEDFVHKLERIRKRIELTLSDALRGRGDLQGDLTDLLEMCQRIQTESIEMLMQPSVEARTLLERLTTREQEVAQLIADGLTNDQIAAQLTIAEPTVKTHVTHILKKFGVRQRSAVAARLRPYQ